MLVLVNVKFNNIKVMRERINKSFTTINSFGTAQKCRITEPYLSLKLEELELSIEYQEKLYKEREEQKQIRAQIREEEIAQHELEKAKQDAEKEATKYLELLAKAKEEAEFLTGEKQEKLNKKIVELEKRVIEAEANKERAISRAQQTRVGHVYIISNVGSFGENIYKIGMTRRLEPMDRVDELGNASVPFPYDVHAMIFTDDAPKLETALHQKFDSRRVNQSK